MKRHHATSIFLQHLTHLECFGASRLMALGRRRRGGGLTRSRNTLRQPSVIYSVHAVSPEVNLIIAPRGVFFITKSSTSCMLRYDSKTGLDWIPRLLSHVLLFRLDLLHFN